jgi:hypothetical protein
MKFDFDDEDAMKTEYNFKGGERGKYADRLNTPPRKLDPLQEEFGFDRPEDGSHIRYLSDVTKHRFRQVKTPWGGYRLWWVIHNAVAHPLIAVFPQRWAFKLHDYTSHKMHGR